MGFRYLDNVKRLGGEPPEAFRLDEGDEGEYNGPDGEHEGQKLDNLEVGLNHGVGLWNDGSLDFGGSRGSRRGSSRL